MSRADFRSDRHYRLSEAFPPDAPDLRLSHSALARPHAPIRYSPPALSPLQRLARGIRNFLGR